MEYDEYVTVPVMMAAIQQGIASAIAETMMKVDQRIEARVPIGIAGTIMADTWMPGTPESNAPEDGTAEVLLDRTASVFTDQGDAPSIVRMKIASPHPGDQFGPDGDERVNIHLTEGGPVAYPYNGASDSIGVPEHQRWITGKQRFLIKTVAGAYIDLSDPANAIILESAAGAFLRLDDAAKKTILQSAGGLAVILNDNTGKLELGKDGLAQADAVFTQTDAQTLSDALTAAIQIAFNTFAPTVQSGSGGVPPTIARTMATGSQVVESQE